MSSAPQRARHRGTTKRIGVFASLCSFLALGKVPEAQGQLVSMPPNRRLEQLERFAPESLFEPRDTNRRDTRAAMIEHRGADADDALAVLFVVDRNQPFSRPGELLFESSQARDGFRRTGR